MDGAGTGLEMLGSDGHTDFVYLISDGQNVKIGKAIRPINRLRELQTGNSQSLELAAVLECFGAATEVEAELHSRFHEFRGLGEWFAIPPDVLEQLVQEKGWHKPVMPERPQASGLSDGSNYQILRRHEHMAGAPIRLAEDQPLPVEMKGVLIAKVSTKIASMPFQFIKWQDGAWRNRSRCLTLEKALGYAHRSNEEFGSGNPVGATFVVNYETDQLWVVPVDGPTSQYSLDRNLR